MGGSGRLGTSKGGEGNLSTPFLSFALIKADFVKGEEES